jgi:ATP-binding cassette subfamily F protein 3
VQPYDGDMDDYRKLLLDERQPAGGKAKSGPKLTKAEERKAAADRRAQLTPLKRAADDAEKRVTKLQGEIAKIETALNAPDLYANEPAKVLTLTKQRGEYQRQLDAAETAWLEASEAYDAARVEIGLSPLSAD